jgi:hypothetical protein
MYSNLNFDCKRSLYSFFEIVIFCILFLN